MIPTLKTTLRRFRRDENGQMVAEFALVIPLIFTMFLTSVELGIYSMRQMFLDRGLDMAIRQVRLNTSNNYSHSDIKLMICNFAGFIDNCDSQLKLEMTPIDVRNFASFASGADCTDASQPVAPVRQFVNGGEHEMMLMRACYKFQPVFPTSGLGYDMVASGDGAGMAKMIALTAFVQEPQ